MPTLVILTTHFGTNFSGGSTATCKIFERLQDHFSKISVVGTQLGDHDFRNLEFHPYRHRREAIQILNSFDRETCIFYGDFFNALILAKCNLPFYFTYHDNWPELGRLSVMFWLQNRYYWRAYREIFSKAQHVFTVSELKLKQVRSYTPKVSLVRNGVVQHPKPNASQTTGEIPRQNVLMVGNIDQRKYTKALSLFKQISKQLDSLPAEQLNSAQTFIIDIYGHVNDTGLCRELERFSFVNIKGYKEHIPYQQYRLLLHTSLMENLSIVWCEAILHRTQVLTFDIGAATEVIYGNRGQTIAPYDLDSMQRELFNMIKLNEDTVFSDLSEDLDSFESEFSWSNAAKCYSQLMFDS